jgi:dTDP-4-amino-4,6-dideoxygalactose transaminase
VLVDVDAATRNIDVNKLSESVRNHSRITGGLRPRAVVAVHLYGQSCDLPALRALCDEANLELIEDCAQAHGTKFGDARAGTFGAAAAFSFYPTKSLGAFGDAGAVVFRESAMADRCRALREYGWTRRYVSEFPGMNSRLDELQAAILTTKLRYVDSETAARQAVARIYDAGLSKIIDTPSVSAGTTHSYHLYVVRSAGRDSLQTWLSAAGIGSGVHYPVPVHLQPAYAGRVPLGLGGMAVTEELAREVISLPMHAFLPHRDASRVAEVVHDWSTSRR